MEGFLLFAQTDMATAIMVLAGAIGSLAAAITSLLAYLKSRNNATAIAEVKTDLGTVAGNVNGHLAIVTGTMQKQAQIIATPEGPERAEMIANLVKPDSQVAAEAARIAESHPKTGGA